MPTALIKRLIPTIDLLYPPFLTKALDMLAALKAAGQSYGAVQGTRTWAQQAVLYAQGRTQPGAIVTNAPPGSSAHNYGIGMDVLRDYDPKLGGPAYVPLQAAIASAGLRRGPAYDLGHFELDLSVHGVTLADLKAVALAATRGQELPAVWALLDRYHW